MNKPKHSLIILATMLIGMMASPLITKAQFGGYTEFVDTGTVISDITFTDIKGNNFTLYSKLDEGYTIVIELGNTTCPPCWAFVQSGVFNTLYEQYGPAGSIAPKKILPMFIECNTLTDSADLHGTGTNTLGDWVSGHDYEIVDLTRENAIATLSPFMVVGNNGYSFDAPHYLIICPDRKLTYSGHDYTQVTIPMVVDKMASRCATGGIADIGSLIRVHSISLYPNPIDEMLNIDIEAMAKTKATYSISNLLGQALIQKEMLLQEGEQTTTFKTNMLSPGLYILSITTEQGVIQQKFVKK